MSYENKQIVTGLYYSRVIASFYNCIEKHTTKSQSDIMFGTYLRTIRFNDWGCPDETNGRFLTKQEIMEIEELVLNGKLEIERYLTKWIFERSFWSDHKLAQEFRDADEELQKREGAE